MCTKNNVYANELYDSIIADSLSQVQKSLRTDREKFRGTIMFDVVRSNNGILQETPSGFELKFISDVIV